LRNQITHNCQEDFAMKRMKGIMWLILAALSLCLPAAAQAKSAYLGTSATDTSLFGHLSQQDPAIRALWGYNGCQPTALTNALVYLQKNYPGVYANYLVSDYSWTTLVQTAVTLGGPSYLNMTQEGFTDGGYHIWPRDMAWGGYLYMQDQDHNMAPQTTWFGTGGPDWLCRWNWNLERPLPTWATINNFNPNPTQIYNNLKNSKAVIILWYGVTLGSDGRVTNWFNGSSHYMTVTGITWDDASQTGILYYIDPVGGSARSSSIWLVDSWALCMDYSNGWYTGPAMIVFQMAVGPGGAAPVQPPTLSQDIDLFDRGLPIYNASLASPSNLNGTSNANRSNFTYSQQYSATPPTTYTIAGDDVMLGSAGQTYQINTVRVWMIYGAPSSQYDRTFASAPNVALKLWAGPAGGSIQPLPVTPTLTRVWYSDGSNYQRTSDGAWRRIWQIDFQVNLKLKGGQKYQFFLDGPFYSSSSGVWQSPSLCVDKAALSNNPRQDGANGQYLVLTLADGVPSGAPSVTSGYDVNIQLLGDSVVTKGVTPPLDLLLSD
jgi:hypothetical protein